MKAVTYAHKFLRPLLSKDKIGLDMTCGRGNDTLFLARHLKYVYTVDIQKEAIAIAKERLKDFDNVIYINADHADISHYIKEKIDFITFNLGYLPNSDSPIRTHPQTTIRALASSFDILNDNGIITLIVYRGHDGALTEYHAIEKYLTDSPYLIVDTYITYKDPFEPVLFILKKGPR